MATIVEYYKYAQLATAAYVRTGGSVNPVDFVNVARGKGGQACITV
jgi:hypothetical protein